MSETNYRQGYSQSTLSSHCARSVASDAAFLVPHLRPDARLLDVGCGPGSITADFANHMPRGTIVGIDISARVLEVADRHLARVRASGSIPETAAVEFRQADVLAGLPFPDDSFDVVFCSQVFPHLPPPDIPVRAGRELRRVLRPGGVLATRDVADMAWFPASLGLVEAFNVPMMRALGRREFGLPGGGMPAVLREAGFDRARMGVGAGTTVWATPEERVSFAGGMRGRLANGDEYKASWVKEGVKEEEIELARKLLAEWIETEDAWYVSTHSEILAWK